MKLLIVLGTRPEVIKLAPVILETKKHRNVELLICSAGQHREMLQQALAAFDITPDITLDVMRENQSLSDLTSALMLALTETFKCYRPDWIILQGDTTTAFMAAIAAFYLKIKIAHVEAGLRTNNLASPFPEEANRQLISRLTNLHFAPTESAANFLLKENINSKNILITGNTVVDAIKMIVNKWQLYPPLLSEKILLMAQKNFALITCHRRESFGQPLLEVCQALLQLSKKYPDMHWILPVHPNPNVSDVFYRELKNTKNIFLIEPLDYETTLFLMSKARIVLTDSGGIQEEAPSFAVPAVVMRNHTERQEGIEAGFAILAGTDANNIIDATRYYLDFADIHSNLTQLPNPYGDGDASTRILAALLTYEVSTAMA